ncbi:NADH dehydrogenase subunit 6 (mitochondrion) [Debaryomyces hansenii]|uniref:NADH-ubiquinone oxidoreductase chain 6 n=1 Tax=Debaryomyces hansenii (strain ATCC 36239 / CBS 767 / BCRC 21394 / JCM 1990 / NBRC 0083 / IGC 2968) TaxID=284592 RepID=NU6M_DEBHA|nr:NADH dehydrogenase subunit 6 [Debaryomyces hansenii]A9RAG2.1 RecName: Full=NADH-ubiquinone oxidoreductase chain 6; AltName: Full=NADH dehydrogenase subunit 6 [Debaryomyces hansenii CBS767]ABF58063.1 NADH dehydrogenase subunit 6 [Debaryomyces hansenii]|eukprot:YP_001621414.1 NADH dehydrogenase subunit 6 (mitochondrion) [Debaryomyces hansenii]
MNTISGMSSLTAIGMLTPVQSMTCLMILFVSTAMCLYSQGFVLMGMLYVTMYVGAMAMLFLFMLSLLKMEYTPQGTITPLMVTLLAMCLMPLDITYETYGMVTQMENVTDELVMVGNQLYTEYAMLLMLTGMMLMLSVMGAMSITK